MTLAGAQPDPQELRPGAILGPYELLLPVGAGGMANVWAARVRATGRIVALKMLLPELAENPSFQEMFLDEARIASRVRHPNVCATFELARHGGVLAIVMEWVGGPSLMRVVRPGPDSGQNLPRVPIHPRLAARIVADACAGLHAAHELVGDDGRPLAVVHRDASPHNILLTPDGHVKVTDFGVAKALGKSHMTLAGQIKGKLAYMAPEQLMGGGVDRRTDVFALGCVLYEATLGTRPFVGEHDPQIMAAIVMGHYEPPGAVLRDYPAELEAVIVRALSSDPDMRFPTADHLRQALEGYLRASGPPVTAVDVAALARERCGEDMSARSRILDGRAPADAANVHKRSTTHSRSGAMAVDGRPPGERRTAVWVAAAVVLGAAVGGGVLSYVRAARKARTAMTSTAVIELDSPGGGAAAAAVGGSATAEATAVGNARTAVAVATAVGRVKLHVAPATAVVRVEGVSLPAGTQSFARPTDGGTLTVLVQADRHEDTLVLVDSATPDEIEVKLVPRRPSSQAAARSAGVADGAPPAPDTPPNPYE